ncbi:MAG: MmcQ/YjbR family DNA-binding protein [Acidimicrobiales bacterium]
MPLTDAEERVRRICMALPAVTEKLTHGAPGFFVGKQFVMLWPDGHHDDRFAHLWCAAPAGEQEASVGTDPERFFRPPYVGGRGWLGVRLDVRVDWDEIESFCEAAYRSVAPGKLIARLDAFAWPGSCQVSEGNLVPSQPPNCKKRWAGAS